MARQLRATAQHAPEMGLLWPPIKEVARLEKAIDMVKEVVRSLEQTVSHTLDKRLEILSAAGLAPTRMISEYLVELGYPKRRVSAANIDVRLHRRRKQGFKQPVSPTARNTKRPITGEGKKPFKTQKM